MKNGDYRSINAGKEFFFLQKIYREHLMLTNYRNKDYLSLLLVSSPLIDDKLFHYTLTSTFIYLFILLLQSSAESNYYRSSKVSTGVKTSTFLCWMRKNIRVENFIWISWYGLNFQVISSVGGNFTCMLTDWKIRSGKT